MKGRRESTWQLEEARRQERFIFKMENTYVSVSLDGKEPVMEQGSDKPERRMGAPVKVRGS